MTLIKRKSVFDKNLSFGKNDNLIKSFFIEIFSMGYIPINDKKSKKLKKNPKLRKMYLE